MASLGPYRLTQKRGARAGVVTYDAVDTRVEREVTLKVIEGADAEALARFHREARVLMRVEHDNVVQLHDYGDNYIACEKLDAIAIEDVIAKYRRPDEAAFNAAASQMVSALNALHASGLVHRDLRLGVFAIEQDGRVVLSDVSLAVGTGTVASSNTAIMVSPLYLAPETIEGAAHSEKGDVYALGVVLLHLLFGEPPLRAEASAAETVELVRTGKLRRSGNAIIDRMTSADPAQRPSLEEVANVFDVVDALTPVREWATGGASGPKRVISPDDWQGQLEVATGGRYTDFQQIGIGGMGRVMKAQDVRMKRTVAIKTMLDPASDAEAVMRFHREARALGRVRHQNIIEVIDYSGRGAALPYIVLEFIDGATMQQVLGVSSMPDGVALCVISELCEALCAVHAAGLVHRDIKPENIFAESSGRVVLGDFGIVRGFEGGEGTFVRKNTVAIGSPLFASPEQVYHPDQVGPASDVFSLGSLLFALVTGKSPFAATGVAAALAKLSKVDRAPLPDKVGDTVRGILSSLLQKNPDARPTTEALRVRLKEALAEAHVLDARREIRKFLGTELDEHTQLFTSATMVRRGGSEDATAIATVTGMKTARITVESNRTAPLDTGAHRTIEAPARRGLMIAAALAVASVLVAGGIIYSRKKPPAPPVQTQIVAEVEPQLPALPTPANQDVPEVPKVVTPPPVAPAPEPKKTLPAEPKKPPPVVVNNAPATVRFFSKPWAYVTIDNETMGQTPVFKLAELKPGKHTIVFDNPTHQPKTMTLDLQPGESRDVRVQLDKK